MWEPYERIHEGACARKTLGFLGGQRRFPWVLTLTLGWGKVEVPPGQSLNPRVVTWVFPREFKKRKKKINTCFGTVFILGFIALEP